MNAGREWHSICRTTLTPNVAITILQSQVTYVHKNQELLNENI